MSHSDFWLSEFIFDEDDYKFDDLDDADNSSVDQENQSAIKYQKMIRLSAARRAVANYVSILTNKQLPVHFVDGGSCTDGQTIYIAGNLDCPDYFDVGVGLALHEASHINHSDFNMYKNVWQNIPREIYDITEPLAIAKLEIAEFVQCIFNYIEDRYIDWHVYTNAPGYRGYYNKLYDEYFNSTIIDKGLTSDLYRIPNIESYSFRIINLTNKNTDLNSLPGLYDVAKEIDLSNIERLNTPAKRFETAMNVSRIVFKNITSHQPKPAGTSTVQVEMTDVSKSDDGEKTTTADNSTVDVNSDKAEASDSDIGGDPTGVTSVDNDQNVIGKDPKYSNPKIQKLKKAFQKQKDFIKGTVSKKKVSKKDKQVLETLEKSKTELNKVGTDFVKEMYNINGHVDSIVVKNMTRELLEDDAFPMTISCFNPRTHKVEIQINENVQTAVNAGIVMGTRLGKKLKLRNEVNVDKYTRKNTGKIDKRLLHEIGAGIENIFYNIRSHRYKKTNIHISVDASSSMRGNKWLNSIKLCTTIAKAASMLENVTVSISFRTVMAGMPYTVIAYDSDKDTFVKVKSLFGYLNPTETTPEGLAFESIMKNLPKINSDTEGYFINISDGEPCFNFKTDTYSVSYTGVHACVHTRKQVKKILASGYKVLSYFISEYNNDLNKNNFKLMYGEDSRFINVHNINSIADTLNGKLLEKD